ncbi:MAG TPA: hypothetical protein VM490_15880 [Armatimonadaceae bacterium]|nr:hypothetical protein [Armatimonadaceae bacterium]
MAVAAAVALLAAAVGSAAKADPTPFTYTNGYGQTWSADGTQTGGVRYDFVTGVGDGAGGANTSSVLAPYTTVAGTADPRVTYGRNFTENNTVTPPRRLAAAFEIPAVVGGLNLGSMTIYGFVPGASSTTVNPFSAAYLAIYSAPPNTFADGDPSPALVAGGFTQNLLVTESNPSTFGVPASFWTGAYRVSSETGLTDASRPIWGLNLDLSRPPGGGASAISALTLAPGKYWLAFSVDVDRALYPDANGFSVLANPTDPVNGQPLSTDGDAQIFSTFGGVHRWNTDQPQFNSANPPPGSPIILSGFPYRLSSVAVPEPGTAPLLALGLSSLLLASGVVRRARAR